MYAPFYRQQLTTDCIQMQPLVDNLQGSGLLYLAIIFDIVIAYFYDLNIHTISWL